MPLAGDRKPQPLAATRFKEYDAQFSPDSAWVAFVSNESGTPEVYVDAGPTTRRQTARSRWAAAPRRDGAATAGTCFTRRPITGQSWRCRSDWAQRSKPALHRVACSRRRGAREPTDAAEHRIRRDAGRSNGFWSMFPAGEPRLVADHGGAELGGWTEALTNSIPGFRSAVQSDSLQVAVRDADGHSKPQHDRADADFVAVFERDRRPTPAHPAETSRSCSRDPRATRRSRKSRCARADARRSANRSGRRSSTTRGPGCSPRLEVARACRSLISQQQASGVVRLA